MALLLLLIIIFSNHISHTDLKVHYTLKFNIENFQKFKSTMCAKMISGEYYKTWL